ncbi:hypothetical protein ACFQ1E_11530 [Sphingomonas canadensis]|uniref:STAS/SEC14 domain-containing protein n=1 Tax=Sphingomonas canadensis TaxID=1219257 RepID=A0ABW3HBH3_9SPHN|nr:hypothetical protein [Sphingomonas canadensis]MCW3836894.1 hypothetical protein [Sphingomonas canadensis]
MYDFRFHITEGILEVRAAGLWTTETVTRYREDLAREAARARVQAGRLKLLFNATQASVQPQATADSLQRLDRVATGANDRVAVVVGASLPLLQARRLLAGWERTELFNSMDAARAWLNALPAA